MRCRSAADMSETARASMPISSRVLFSMRKANEIRYHLYEVNVDGTYTCIEIHGTVVTEEARNKAKQEQQKYYQQAQDKCEYREPRRRPVGKSSSALRMEDLKRAQAEYEACVARKAEEMRKADQTDTQ